MTCIATPAEVNVIASEQTNASLQYFVVFKVRDPIQVLDVYYDADNTEFRVREKDETVSEFVVAQMPNWIEVCFNVYYYA